MSRAPRIVAGLGTWLFVVLTTAQVLGYFVYSWFVPHELRYCQVWAVSIGGKLHEPIGLTYRGLAGQVLAGAEAALVVTAMVLSLRRHLVLRRLGHVGLIAWACLWLVNEAWFFVLQSLTVRGLRLSMVSVFSACTVLRAVLQWTPSRVGTKPLTTEST